MARELGLHEGTLGRWVDLDRRARDGEGPLSESERDELNRLRKQNAELAMERDVLKRSAALWVKDVRRLFLRTGHREAEPLGVVMKYDKHDLVGPRQRQFPRWHNGSSILSGHGLVDHGRRV